MAGLCQPATAPHEPPLRPLRRLRPGPRLSGLEPSAPGRLSGCSAFSRAASCVGLSLVARALWRRRPATALAASRRAAGLAAGLAGLGSPVPVRAEGFQSLSWLPIDEAPATEQIFERFETDKEWSVDFIVYLSRILLNYDKGSRTWWQTEVVPAVDATLEGPPGTARLRKRAAKLRDIFADYAASVEVGLRKYQEEGRRKSGLLKRLVDRYGSSEESRRQLALAFTLLEDQPLELLSNLLGTLGLDSRLQAVFSPALSDYLAMDPTRLLPNTQYPVWNGGLNRWVIPGLQSAQPYKSAFDEMDRGAAVSVFGARGTEVVVKERPLTPGDFGLFALSGAFGCAITHSVVIPLDVVKTRLQTSPGSYSGLISGAVQIQKEEGWRGLLAGWEPTVLGYLWYGVTVYPGYEFFKRLYLSLFPAEELRVLLVVLAGATATVFACFGVCPAEACRIRMVANPELDQQGLLKVVQLISERDGLGILYDGLSTLLVRQVLFGMMKFLVFDYFADFVFDLQPVLAERMETQLLVSLFSGAVAGVVSSIVSQPADTVLTRMNQKEGRANFLDTAKEIFESEGVGGFFAGLGSRSVWAACIISGQFFLYDVCKSFLGVKDLRMFLNVQV
ncbi:unnamed protein product [Effrenium voratum]|nr:unnamed protein product [Effrenium voratum]